MRVLVVSRHYERPGRLTGANVHRQCVELTRIGLDVVVICPIPRGRRGSEMWKRLARTPRSAWSTVLDGVPVTYIPYTNVPHFLSPNLDARALRRVVRRTIRAREGAAFDLVHAHMLFPMGWAALEIAEWLGVPLVVTAHGSDVHTNPRRSRRIRRLTRAVLRKADQVLTVSRDLADRVQDLEGAARKPVVSHFGVDERLFRPPADRIEERRSLHLPVQGVGICSVGRLHKAKGVFELLQAFSELAARHSDTWLLFVGDGPARPFLHKRTAELRLTDRVHFAGSAAHADVAKWMRATNIFAFPSYQEGLPNVVLEAMATALPVVASRVGGVPEAVSSRTGLLVPPKDPSALEAALERLLRSPTERTRLGLRAREHVVENFSWPHTANALHSIYQAVHRAQSGSGPHVPQE